MCNIRNQRMKERRVAVRARILVTQNEIRKKMAAKK